MIGSGALRAGLRLSSVPALTEGTVADAVRFDQAAFPVRVLVRSCNFGDSSLLAGLGAAGDGAGGALTSSHKGGDYAFFGLGIGVGCAIIRARVDWAIAAWICA